MSEFGELDVFVGNAGITGKPEPLADIQLDEYARVLASNLRSQVMRCNPALPHIATGGGGSVVLMASWAGLRGNGQFALMRLA
jgi:NAD(P)-dependent dehydrogenase (short-subunit alcohol dehydrogenase family)